MFLCCVYAHICIYTLCIYKHVSTYICVYIYICISTCINKARCKGFLHGNVYIHKYIYEQSLACRARESRTTLQLLCYVGGWGAAKLVHGERREALKGLSQGGHVNVLVCF